MTKRRVLLALLAAAPAVAFAMFGGDSRAAVPVQLPGDTVISAARLSSLYAWREGDKLVIAVTLGGAREPSEDQAGAYSADTLLSLKIDSDEDRQADHVIYVRFGQNENDKWGVQVEGLPGTEDAIEGPVDTTLEGEGDTKAFAGLRDDPFFFDLQGWEETLKEGSPQFAGLTGDPRDSLAGRNVTAVVLEMSFDDVVTDGKPIEVWATSAIK